MDFAFGLIRQWINIYILKYMSFGLEFENKKRISFFMRYDRDSIVGVFFVSVCFSYFSPIFFFIHF